MAVKRRGGLGRGLDKLIPNKSAFSDSVKSKVSPDNGVKTANAETAPEDSLIRNESQNNDSEMAISEPIQEKMEEKLEPSNQSGSNMISSEMSTDSNDSYSETEDESASHTEGVDVNDSSSESNDKGDSVLIMKISSVEPNRDQPRKHFSEEGIEELASSIKQYGIIQPLLVQKREDYYEIIAGERRWRAAMKAGLKEVPVIVKDYSNREAVEISLIENIQREDLNPIEEALAYDRLIQEFELTQEQVAGRVSKSRSAVTNSLRLLKLADDVRQMVIAGDISEGHARTLLGLPNEEMQRLLAERIVKEKLSVRETEKLVKKLTSNTPKKTKARDYQKEAILGNLSEQLKIILGTKVSITEKGKSKGKIEIEYYSDDELNRIFEMLQSLNKY